jgi:hypothetical protein
VRRLFVALAFCFCSLAMQGQKTRYGQDLPHAKPGIDYPIKLHVSGVRYRQEYVGSGQTADIIYVDVVMNGSDVVMNEKKLELRGDKEFPFQFYKLSPGDYQARLLKDPHKMENTPIFRIYEVVFPDKTVGSFTVTGISE